MWRRLFVKPSSEPKFKYQPSALRTSVDEEALAEYVYSKVIYQAGVNFESKPMVIICACNLPNPAEVDYDRILERILLKLDLFVESDYTVVLFAGGAKHNPGWAWMFRAYKSLGRKYKKNLKSLYVVQPTTWARLYLDVMNAVISRKFSKKMKYVFTLSELANYVPLTQIDIPPAVYEYNLKFEDKITLPQSSIDDENGPLMFGIPIEQLMGSEGEHGLPRVVKDCVTFLRAEGLYTEGVFRRSPSSVLLKQAREAYDRGNPINLQDYGVHVAAVLLKMFFNNLPIAVFPVETYDILRQIRQKPHHHSKIEFIRSNIFPLLSHSTILLLRYVCGLLVDISKHKDKNLMTSHNLAILFAPNLVHSGNPILDVSMCSLVGGNLSECSGSGGVGILMKLAIEYFDLIFEGYEDPSDRIRRDVESEKTILISILNSSLDQNKGDNHNNKKNSNNNKKNNNNIDNNNNNNNNHHNSNNNNNNNDNNNNNNKNNNNNNNKTEKNTKSPSSSSTPPKYPSIKRMHSLAALKTLLSTMNTTSTTTTMTPTTRKNNSLSLSSLPSFSSSPTSSSLSSPSFSSSLMTTTTNTTTMTTTLCNSDPFRVGAGVEISGIKVQGMVSLSNSHNNNNNSNDNNNNYNSNDIYRSLHKPRNSIDELRRANSYFY